MYKACRYIEKFFLKFLFLYGSRSHLINKIIYEHKENLPELASLEPELTEAKPSGLCASLGLIGVEGGVDGL